MGEVYQAKDTRLDRTVAIKVLSPYWADNPEMKLRFEREAQAVASLNHPNICVLYDIGTQDRTDFLVMEYLEGETLAARIERGPLDIDEALKVGIAIADALDKAHRRGVVHRDLKPSNVMLTATGPKLLDFGLAKYTAPGAAPSPKSTSGRIGTPAPRTPTMTPTMLPSRKDLTTPGAIMGTLQYMAPEQLEGSDADPRSDIFAFGALFHEVLTGKKAFEGKTQLLLMSAIAASHPEPPSKVQPATPPGLDHIVKICLAKDPNERWQTARDLLIQLQWVAEVGEAAIAVPQAPARRSSDKFLTLALVAACVVAAVIVVPAYLYLRGARQPSETRFHTVLGALGTTQSIDASAVDFSAVSPNGRWVVSFTYASEGRNNAGVRFPRGPGTLSVIPIHTSTPQVLEGTEGAAQPFWSPDSRWIGFFAAGKLKKVEVTGGPPKEIGSAPDFAGGAWAGDGTIVFGSTKGLFRVSDQGGNPELITKLQPSESGHFWPRFLPDGKHYLYLVWTGQPSNRAIVAGLLGAKETSPVMTAAESQAVYAEPGFLLFHRERAVYAQTFSASKLKLSGDPIRVADEVTYNTATGRGSFDVSQNGDVLVYYHNGVSNGGGGAESWGWQATWSDRTGNTKPDKDLPGPFGFYRGVDVSPDGMRIAVHRHDGNGGDIWIIEPRGSVTQLTFDASHDNSSPLWSPDGMQIAYASLQKGKWGIYKALSSGSGAEELVCCESEVLKTPVSWSPDGKHIIYSMQDPKNGVDLWMVDLDGEKKTAPLIATPANETHARVSPDGKWIAYVSDVTAGQKEIYVRPFPSGTGQWRISTGGGDWPRWRRDSKELFYETPVPENTANNTYTVFSAMLSVSSSTLIPENPKEVLIGLVAYNLTHPGGEFTPYTIDPDGQRFLWFQRVLPQGSTSSSPYTPDPPNNLTIAMHWAAGLKGK
jgi:Tol biopolymer transport system component